MNNVQAQVPSGRELHAYWAAEPERPPYVKRAPEQSMYLSEIGGCQRKVWLRINRFSATPFSATSTAAMQRGIAFERYVQLLFASWCAKRGIAYSRQTQVRTPYGNGKLDLWIPALNHLVEVKTTESKGRDYLPRQSHVDQVLMYLTYYTGIDPDAVPGVALSPEQPSAELCYALWDTEEVLSFVVDPTAPENVARVEFLQSWCVETAQALKLGIIPEPLGEATRFPCQWRASNELGYDRCSYYAHCYGKGE